MTTLYLKYRPKMFADLDSVDARESLVKLFALGNIPHALLFTGPKGIGKTSAARIVAKSLICEEKTKSSFEPCNQCPACLSVDNGSNVDVYEIDAASNRGIDDIRDLREKIKLSPAQSKYKIFIVDEVHMLTTESFNALLKTLEEPPKHAFFILCTTDFEKLPKTIVSRCTRVHFKKATKMEVLNRLKKVTEAEAIEYEEAGLVVLANSCEGSFRDAVKLLEQANSLGKVTEDTAMKVVGLNNTFPVGQLLVFLEKQQVKEALDWINRAAEANLNFKLVIQDMVEKLRQMMLKSFGIPVELGTPEYVFSLDQIQRLVRLLTVANYELKQSPIASLPLEMAVIEYLSAPEIPPAGGSKIVAEVDKKTDVLSDNNNLAIKQLNNERANVTKEKVGDKITPVTTSVTIHDKNLGDSWPLILEAVKPLNHSVLAFLRASRPLSLDNQGNMTIEVFYKFHKDQLEKDQCRRIFEQAAGQVLATEVKLKCVLGEGKPKSVVKEEPVYEVHLDTPSLPKKQTDDIIDIAEHIFNGGTIQ